MSFLLSQSSVVHQQLGTCDAQGHGQAVASGCSPATGGSVSATDSSSINAHQQASSPGRYTGVSSSGDLALLRCL